VSDDENLRLELLVARAKNRWLDQALDEADLTVQEQTDQWASLTKQFRALAPDLVNRQKLTSKAAASNRHGADARARRAQKLQAKGLSNKQIASAVRFKDGSRPSDRTVTRWLSRKIDPKT
jgi:hypothetical protein